MKPNRVSFNNSLGWRSRGAVVFGASPNWTTGDDVGARHAPDCSRDRWIFHDGGGAIVDVDPS
jgi:hypothetical protein